MRDWTITSLLLLFGLAATLFALWVWSLHAIERELKEIPTEVQSSEVPEIQEEIDRFIDGKG